MKWMYIDIHQRLVHIHETFVCGEEEYTKTDASQRDVVMISQADAELLPLQTATG